MKRIKASKYFQNYLMSLAIRKMHIKTTLRPKVKKK